MPRRWKRLFRFGSLLLASAFPRNSIALATGAVEFEVVSGRAVEAVAGFAQGLPFAPGSLPFSTTIGLFGSVIPANWRDLHFGDLAHGGAGRFPDFAECVQVLEFDRYLLHLSRLAHFGKAGTGEQLVQRLPLFRARARIYIPGKEVTLERLARSFERIHQPVQTSHRPTSPHRIGRCQFEQ